VRHMLSQVATMRQITDALRFKFEEDSQNLLTTHIRVLKNKVAF